MASNNTEVFLLSVKETFKHWPILMIANQQGFGGQYAGEKEAWLSESVIQIFQDNDVVHPDELEDFISEALFNEFDTIVDDGSLPEVSMKLCQYYQLCKSNNGDQVLASLRTMASAASSLSNMPVQKVENLSDDDEEESGTNGHSTNGFNGDMQDTTSTMETDEKQPEVDEDGWEVVRRSRKK